MMHAQDHLSGRPGHLDPGQQHQLKKFRQIIEEKGLYDPLRHDEACMCRFLRARKWDLNAALEMFEAAEKWRKEFKVDELYHQFEYPEKQEVDKYYPQFYHKTDNDGRPIYIEQLGKLDLRALYQVTTPERQLQKLVVEYEKFQRERLPVVSKERGELVETSCTIMDLKNVGVGQFWKVSTYVQQASNIGQHYYPETMGKFYIINAPYIFTTVWSVVKGWLDPVTVEKIRILGSGYEKELTEQIPPENLPASLGGTCNCPEGCSLSDAGPWNTEEGKRILQEVRADKDKEVKAAAQ
ncbi:putative SEC14-phosphatidylinositol/phosphatidylcholine transfer protein [Ceraceosorus guamensis]|uniref:Putative SEC14-phosphatidylinositol/phosphatidylcholine transfer protein n=1 Tax=Ceraceosorus guamensis TaxID=1522189 RepID=A0A316VVH6_9BASI|nr:putative SEC14-phosphatidylinositol/phosphatidylcholine transfer protein [Ceraceosorus guamensis]PWN41459.1 putative SEC14-phosphatidylinositol/phosphatidylcholine transfer protein [Ceraceosorus guamensis]